MTYRRFVHLLLASVLALTVCTPALVARAATATLVKTTRTSAWTPPSPDPSGITYWPRKTHLVLVDGEVEEMAIWAGANMFEATLQGGLVKTYDISSFNTEPVGIDIEIADNEDFFISNDSQKTIFEIDIGADGEFGTGDDKRRAFLTSGWGNTDPEGLTFGGGKLYTVDGGASRVYITQDGGNGIFEGSDPTTSFDVGGLGIRDPEGIDYDTATGNLWIVDRSRAILNEVTTSGTLVQSFNLGTLVGAVNPGDVTLAPSSSTSDAATVQNLYIVDRGVDNNDDPTENDGKIYELSLSGGTPPPTGNLLVNGSFEADANGDGKPDSWSTSAKFTRSTEIPAAAGTYVGRFAATDNAGANSLQTVTASAGTTYTLACSANIPTQNDTTFTFKVLVRWVNSSNSAISTWTVKTWTAHTGGTWASATGSKAAPSGTVKAEVRLVASSLNGKIYVDQCSFGS